MADGTMRLKTGLAEMLKGGVIMDVVNADQARIAEKAGAVAVMALERVPSDIRAQGAWPGWRASARCARSWRR
jgi:pyridoxal 5'-phosphate synthase pdxS subunit